MAGMIGMAQTLAVYHYGYHTLKNRLVQYHEPTREPSDAEAVLEWGLDTPFTSQDKPPLAVAMVVTLNGVRSLRRYRLVIMQKSKLRLPQEVTAALCSFTQSGPPPHGKWLFSVFYRSGVPVWLCRGRLPLSFMALCFLQWISISCPSAPRQQDTLSSGHQGPEDIHHTGYPLL